MFLLHIFFDERLINTIGLFESADAAEAAARRRMDGGTSAGAWEPCDPGWGGMRAWCAVLESIIGRSKVRTIEIVELSVLPPGGGGERDTIFDQVPDGTGGILK